MINLIFLHHYDYYYVGLFTWAHIPIFFQSLTFLIISSPYHIHLYTWSTQLVTLVQHMCWFFKVSNSPMFLFLNSPYKGRWFPFSFRIWFAQPGFSISARITAFRCSSIGGRGACLAFVYFTTTTRDGGLTVLGHVEFCWWLDPEEIPPESWAACKYCPDVIWTTYLLDPFGETSLFTWLSVSLRYSTISRMRIDPSLSACVMIRSLTAYQQRNYPPPTTMSVLIWT